MNADSNEQNRAPNPSHVNLPPCKEPYPPILDFLDRRFPRIGRQIWKDRINDGKVTESDGTPISLSTPYKPGMKLLYYREVPQEVRVPFEERIIFQSEHLLVADKPHFLPVTPSGPYVHETLLYRLKEKTGLKYLVPLHRLDRETAGLVIFATNRETSGPYGDLFDHRKIEKLYEAIGTLPESDRTEWLVESEIIPGEHWLVMTEGDGAPNARTRIRLTEKAGDRGRFELEPLTGRTHQLRLHMVRIGSRIINDRFYPVLLPEIKGRLTDPLQLLAKRIAFEDPLTHRAMAFESARTLQI